MDYNLDQIAEVATNLLQGFEYLTAASTVYKVGVSSLSSLYPNTIKELQILNPLEEKILSDQDIISFFLDD